MAITLEHTAFQFCNNYVKYIKYVILIYSGHALSYTSASLASLKAYWNKGNNYFA